MTAGWSCRSSNVQRYLPFKSYVLVAHAFAFKCGQKVLFNSTTVAIAKDEKHNFDADYNAPLSL